MSDGPTFSCIVRWADGKSIHYMFRTSKWYYAERAAKRLAKDARPGEKIESISSERAYARNFGPSPSDRVRQERPQHRD